MRGAVLRDFDRLDGKPSDVCLIVEGCYPHIAGGVSTWVDWLIRSQPDVAFSVVSIVVSGGERIARYAFPDNLLAFREIELGSDKARSLAALTPRRLVGRLTRRRGLDPIEREALVAPLTHFLLSGSLGDLGEIFATVSRKDIGLDELLRGRGSYELAAATYRLLMPYGIFEDFYWAWHSLVGGLFTVLKAPLPHSRTFHAISTGYAGLLLARAKIEFDARTIVTEHGIYTNERRIELLMADWLVDAIDYGYRLDRDRLDIRDLWVRAFESYARACYAGADAITTLFADNQPMQRELGAAPAKLKVIPNGIDFERFAAIPLPPPDAPPTVALIGRVVPIKDIKTFIAAVDRLRRRVPNVRALVAGPMDEDETYAQECHDLCAALRLDGTLTFTGRVDVLDLLREVHVVALTSLSEAQPLTVLEAGAAARACVTTNVGACREILDGARDEQPALGRGGLVADILDADGIADALADLLGDPTKGLAYGRALQERVRRFYTTPIARAHYRDVYGLTRADTGRRWPA